MLARYALSVVSIIITAILIIACLSNLTPIPISLISFTASVPEGVLLAIGLVVGWLGGLSISQILAKKINTEKRKLEWVAQDAKLAAEVKSDREKQLEAKINTLEAALKSALKK